MVTLEAASARHIRALVGLLRSEHTVRQYAQFEAAFCRYAARELGRAPVVTDLTLDAVGDFAAGLMASGRSRDTARQYKAILKRWSGFLARTYHWPADPLADMDLGKRRVRPVQVFDASDVARMLDAVHRGHKEVILRNRAAVLLLLDTGLRASELCDLALSDITLPNARGEGGELRVRHGKGDKARTVPLRNTPAATALELYTEDERPALARKARNPSDVVFLASDGDPWTRQALLQLVKKLGSRAGVEGKRVSPHTFRSTFATESVLANNPVFAVQAAMGHADAGQTSRYVSAAELQRVPFVSPLQREGWKRVR